MLPASRLRQRWQSLQEGTTKNPLTIVVPTLGRDTLGAMVQSIRNQTVKDVDVLIIPDMGDNSTGLTMNRGVRFVDTEWVTFVADDDGLHPQYVEWALEEMHDCDVVVFDVEMQTGSVSSYDTIEHGKSHGIFFVKTALCRLHPFIREQLEVPINEDYEFLKAIYDAGAKFKFIKRVSYYVHPHVPRP